MKNIKLESNKIDIIMLFLCILASYLYTTLYGLIIKNFINNYYDIFNFGLNLSTLGIYSFYSLTSFMGYLMFSKSMFINKKVKRD